MAKSNIDKIAHCTNSIAQKQQLFLKSKSAKDKAIYKRIISEFKKQRKRWTTIEAKEIQTKQLELFN